MRFEKQVMVLCAEALAADEEAEVRKKFGELRLILHQHIEQLRADLLGAYAMGLVRPSWFEEGTTPSRDSEAKGRLRKQTAGEPGRTWQQVVHEIAIETDHAKARQLGMELNRILQSQTASADGS